MPSVLVVDCVVICWPAVFFLCVQVDLLKRNVSSQMPSTSSVHCLTWPSTSSPSTKDDDVVKFFFTSVMCATLSYFVSAVLRLFIGSVKKTVYSSSRVGDVRTLRCDPESSLPELRWTSMCVSLLSKPVWPPLLELECVPEHLSCFSVGHFCSSDLLFLHLNTKLKRSLPSLFRFQSGGYMGFPSSCRPLFIAGKLSPTTGRGS